MSETNSATLQAYEQRAGAYIEGTPHEIAVPTREWLDLAVGGLQQSARILEIGSAFGRDAAYLAASGYHIEVSDAADSFVEELKSRGFLPRKLNLLKDEIERQYDLILANAVLLHFTTSEFSIALNTLRAALVGGGRLAVTLKQGDGEEWSDAKIGSPRFFRYWRPEPLRRALKAASFDDISIVEVRTEGFHADWLYVIAR